jgi:hypothetical protein
MDIEMSAPNTSYDLVEVAVLARPRSPACRPKRWRDRRGAQPEALREVKVAHGGDLRTAGAGQREIKGCRRPPAEAGKRVGAAGRR